MACKKKAALDGVSPDARRKPRAHNGGAGANGRRLGRRRPGAPLSPAPVMIAARTSSSSATRLGQAHDDLRVHRVMDLGTIDGQVGDVVADIEQ
jgi:hypothetical protein